MEHLPEFIMNHYQLCAAFCGVFMLILLNEWQQKMAGANAIEPSQVVTLMNRQNAIVFDIRSNEQFKQGHIISAISIPATIKDSMNKYKSKNIIIVCDNGTQSITFANRLKKEGFERVSALQGGVAAWKEANLPIETSQTKKKKK